MKKLFLAAVLITNLSLVKVNAQIVKEQDLSVEQSLGDKDIKREQSEKQTFIPIKFKKTVAVEQDLRLSDDVLGKLNQFAKNLETLVQEVKGQVIEQPGSIINDLIKLEIKVANLLIPKIRDITAQIRNPRVRREILKSVSIIEDFVKQIKQIPPIEQNLNIKYDEIDQFLGLIAEFLHIQSRAIANVAKQLNSQAAANISAFKKREAQILEHAVNSSK